ALNFLDSVAGRLARGQFSHNACAADSLTNIAECLMSALGRPVQQLMSAEGQKRAYRAANHAIRKKRMSTSRIAGKAPPLNLPLGQKRASAAQKSRGRPACKIRPWSYN